MKSLSKIKYLESRNRIHREQRQLRNEREKYLEMKEIYQQDLLDINLKIEYRERFRGTWSTESDSE